MVPRRKPAVVAIALLSVLGGPPAWAQPTQGKVGGVVRDSTGAVIPGATITATNPSTNVTQSTTTANDGTFSLSLPPGAYRVTAALAGFRTATQAIDLAGGAQKQLDFLLEPQVIEELTVTAMKRESTLFEVPFSVAAPTDEVLRARGVEDIEGVAANVGGFTVQNLGPGQSQVAMRGVSAGQIVRDQPGVKEQVGTYLDESAISLFTPDIDLVDIDRVG